MFFHSDEQAYVNSFTVSGVWEPAQSRGELNAFDTWLNTSPDAEPMAGDELT